MSARSSSAPALPRRRAGTPAPALTPALALAAATLAAVPAMANDSSAQLGAGGLVLTIQSGITMTSEDLRISSDKVEIAYEFTNATDKDVTTLVAFPMPKLSGNEEAFNIQLPKENDPVDFMDFKVQVEGKPVKTEVEQRASVFGIDITDRLKADGVPINLHARPGVDEILAKLPPEKKAFYIQRGLADFSDKTPMAAEWDVSTTFYWMQTFPAKKTIKVTHSYRPIIGTALLGEFTLNDPKQIRELTGPYCLDKNGESGLRKALQARKQKTPDNVYLTQTRIDYILRTAGNWAGPIGNFKLTIEKPAADTVMSLCFPGQFQKTSPTTFVYQGKDFSPEQDLSILFVSTR